MGPGISISVQSGGGGAARFGALAFVSPAKVLQYCRSDVGITLNATTVSAWADQSGAGLHYTQSNASKQPTYSATGGPNSTPLVQLDGVGDAMVSSLTTPAPGTTPTTIWLVARVDMWNVSRRIVSSSDSLKKLLFLTTATPEISLFNGSTANANTAGTVGSSFRFLAYFSNSTADRLKIGATNVTGASAGNSAADTARHLGNDTANSAIVSFSEVLYISGSLTAGEEAALDGYVTTRYGAGLV